jgi:hypothetical protein
VSGDSATIQPDHAQCVTPSRLSTDRWAVHARIGLVLVVEVPHVRQRKAHRSKRAPPSARCSLSRPAIRISFSRNLRFSRSTWSRSRFPGRGPIPLSWLRWPRSSRTSWTYTASGLERRRAHDRDHQTTGDRPPARFTSLWRGRFENWPTWPRSPGITLTRSIGLRVSLMVSTTISVACSSWSARSINWRSISRNLRQRGPHASQRQGGGGAHMTETKTFPFVLFCRIMLRAVSALNLPPSPSAPVCPVRPRCAGLFRSCSVLVRPLSSADAR